MPVLRLLPWIVWVALVLFSVATYGNIPGDIPRHLNAAGEVTADIPRSFLGWMLLPIIAFLTQALMTWLTSLLPRRPDLFNFSEKERLLRIPEAYRGPVLDRMRDTMDVLGLMTMIVMAYVQVMMWRAALGDSAKGLSVWLIVATVMFTPLALIMTSRVNTAVDEAERRWKAAEPRER